MEVTNLKMERMAPGHCTGQFAFAEFIRVYGLNFDRAGLGSITFLPLKVVRRSEEMGSGSEAMIFYVSKTRRDPIA